MTPEQEIILLKERIQLLESTLSALIKTDKYYFGKHLVLADGANIFFSSGTGTKIGASADKIAFYGTAPTARQTGVAVSAAGIHAALVTLGLITS